MTMITDAEDVSTLSCSPDTTYEERKNVMDKEDVIMLSSSPDTTYKERKNMLEVIICTGKKVAKRILKKPSNKKFEQRTYYVDQTQIHRDRAKNTAMRYVATGMTRKGYIKETTNVFFDHLPKDSAFHSHPFFHNIPFVATRDGIQHAWLEELRTLEQEIRNTHHSRPHKYGANMGYNVGLSIVSGGIYANHSKKVSGSIHTASLVKNRPELEVRIVKCFKKILGALYGDQGWYKRLLRITTQLNQHTNERRTIPGLPLSGLWLTERPNQDKVHCDSNVVGAAFLLTSSDVKGSTLCLSSPTGKIVMHDLKPGEILAGSWSNYGHCNMKVDEHPGNYRTSWTLYLDGRVFCRRFKCVDN
jgi:hypothetical protein